MIAEAEEPEPRDAAEIQRSYEAIREISRLVMEASPEVTRRGAKQSGSFPKLPETPWKALQGCGKTFRVLRM